MFNTVVTQIFSMHNVYFYYDIPSKLGRAEKTYLSIRRFLPRSHSIDPVARARTHVSRMNWI